MYASSPEYFARQTAACAAHGARLLGGCCGTGPEHIAALVKALGSASPEVRIEAPSTEELTAGTAVPTRLARRLQEGKVVLVDLDPPKHLDTEPVTAALGPAFEDLKFSAQRTGDEILALITEEETPVYDRPRGLGRRRTRENFSTGSECFRPCLDVFVPQSLTGGQERRRCVDLIEEENPNRVRPLRRRRLRRRHFQKSAGE